MKTKLLFIIVLILAFLSACGQATPGGVTQSTSVPSTPESTSTPVAIVPSDTPTTVVPTSAPTGMVPTEMRLVVKTADKRIQIVKANISLRSAYNPAFTGLNPMGGVINGIPYVYDFTTFPTVMAVETDGPVQQEFIQNPTYGLAVWPGDQPRLAWGTQLKVPNTPSTLQMSASDGSQLETLLTQEASKPALQIVAQRWSADGKSLYFSREPVGIGGYIVFTGASSLYKIDIASKQVTELIPANLPPDKASCLDAVSVDYRYVADHCAQNAITVRDLSSGAATTLQPPDGLTGWRVLGSSRFSPDGSRVAFALAKGDPNGEQGWVAVSESIQGSSSLILTGDPGVSYTVVGWLNDQTLLIQSTPVPTVEGNDNQLWSVNIDGSNLTKVVDGSFIVAMDNH